MPQPLAGKAHRGETGHVPRARVNDIELYYEVQGDGQPVLLIPGLGVGLDFFRPIIDGLAASCRVVAFDPRGAGQSDKPDVPYTIDGMTDDAVGLLQHLGIGRATVIGSSMGGRVALILALDHQELVERLVLLATSARVPRPPLLSRRWLLMEVFPKLHLPMSIEAQPRYAWERQKQASVGFDCTSRLGELKVPTLVVHGTGDHLVPFSLGQEMASHIVDVHLVTVPDGHRALVTTHAGRVVEEVERFMAVPQQSPESPD